MRYDSEWYARDPVYGYLAAQQEWLDEQNGLNQVVQTVPTETDAGASVEAPVVGASGSGGPVSTPATSYDYPVSGASDLAWAQHPHRVLWVARSDGLLVGLTLMLDQDVIAWHRHPMVNGAVESVCVVPSPSESSDRLWMVVRREIEGVQVRYVEYLTAVHEPESATDLDGYCYLDSSVVYAGAPTTVLTGLGHLEGQSVAVWGDGVDCGDYEVDGGEITLDAAVEYAAVGLNVPARIVLLPLDKAPGQQKVIERAYAVVAEMGGLAYSSPSAPGMKRAMKLRRASDAQDIVTPLYTGGVTWDLDSGWETSGQMALGAIRPYPLTILALHADVHISER